MLEREFGTRSLAATVSIRNNPSGRPVPSGFAQAHEYAIFVKKSPDSKVCKLPRSEKQAARYRHSDATGPYMWELFRKRGSNSERENRPTLYYPIYVSGNTVRVPRIEWVPDTREWRVLEQPNTNETVVYPIDESGTERTWRGQPEDIASNHTKYKAEESGGRITVYYKFRPSEGVLPLTLWNDAKYSATEHGTGLLKHYFTEYNVFSYPKSVYAVEDCLWVSGAKQDDVTVFDFFAGSGTTGHATVNLNRRDGGKRKFILVEMGQYFDTGNRSPPSISSMIARCLAGCKDFFGRSSISS